MRCFTKKSYRARVAGFAKWQYVGILLIFFHSIMVKDSFKANHSDVCFLRFWQISSFLHVTSWNIVLRQAMVAYCRFSECDLLLAFKPVFHIVLDTMWNTLYSPPGRGCRQLNSLWNSTNSRLELRILSENPACTPLPDVCRTPTANDN